MTETYFITFKIFFNSFNNWFPQVLIAIQKKTTITTVHGVKRVGGLLKCFHLVLMFGHSHHLDNLDSNPPPPPPRNSGSLLQALEQCQFDVKTIENAIK